MDKCEPQHHGEKVKILESMVLCYLFRVIQEQGDCCGEVVTVSHTVNHSEAEFKQALRTLGAGGDSGCDSFVEGKLPQDMGKQVENSSSTIKVVLGWCQLNCSLKA